MGGNAIKKDGKSVCGRLPKIQYEIVKEYILSVLRNHFICEIVLECPGKESFGDIDILYSYSSSCKADMISFVKTYFEVSELTFIVQNGYVLSFAFDCSKILGPDDFEAKYFQIDLIRMESFESIEMARFYFSYSDFGAIVGRIANYHGLKFGESGLWCDIYEQTVIPTLPLDVRKTLGKIILSSNPREICDFLGYDFESWKNEIPKLLDPDFLTNYSPKLDENCEIFPDIPKSYKFIFDWIISSRFFHKNMFMFLNADHRKRQDKRPFYKSFLKYIGILEEEEEHAHVTFTKEKSDNLQIEAIQYFNKTDDLEMLLKEIDRKKKHQSKFSESQLIVCFKECAGIEVKDKDVGQKLVCSRSFVSKNPIVTAGKNFLIITKKMWLRNTCAILLF